MKLNIDDYTIKRVKRGEIVIRNVERQSSASLGAEAVALINAHVDDILNVLVDYQNYPQDYPEVKRIKILESSENNYTVKMTVSVNILLPDYNFTIKSDKGADFMNFKQSKGDFKEMSGSWMFEPIKNENGTDATLAIYTNKILLSGIFSLVPDALVDKLLTFKLPGVIRNLKKILANRNLSQSSQS